MTLHHDRPPPDAWLSEVRYRENARVYVTGQANAESMVAEMVGELRVKRVNVSQEMSSSYRQVASFGDGLATPVSDGPRDAHEDMGCVSRAGDAGNVVPETICSWEAMAIQLFE